VSSGPARKGDLDHLEQPHPEVISLERVWDAEALEIPPALISSFSGSFPELRGRAGSGCGNRARPY